MTPLPPPPPPTLAGNDDDVESARDDNVRAGRARGRKLFCQCNANKQYRVAAKTILRPRRTESSGSRLQSGRVLCIQAPTLVIHDSKKSVGHDDGGPAIPTQKETASKCMSAACRPIAHWRGAISTEEANSPHSPLNSVAPSSKLANVSRVVLAYTPPLTPPSPLLPLTEGSHNSQCCRNIILSLSLFPAFLPRFVFIQPLCREQEIRVQIAT